MIYAYDHRGRMVTKALCSSAPLRLIKTTTYLWDDWNIIREVVREGYSVAVTDNIWGLDIDGTLQGAGGVGGLLAVVRDDGVFLPTYDANGTANCPECRLTFTYKWSDGHRSERRRRRDTKPE